MNMGTDFVSSAQSLWSESLMVAAKPVIGKM